MEGGQEVDKAELSAAAQASMPLLTVPLKVQAGLLDKKQIAILLLMGTFFYYDMYARHDVVIQSACLWLEDVDSI